MENIERVRDVEERRALRAELDRLTSNQIKELQQEVDDLKNKLTDVLLWREKHMEQYQLDQPTLSVLRHIAGFSVVVRWVAIGVLGVLSAIGAAQLAFETVQKWIVK